MLCFTHLHIVQQIFLLFQILCNEILFNKSIENMEKNHFTYLIDCRLASKATP